MAEASPRTAGGPGGEPLVVDGRALVDVTLSDAADSEAARATVERLRGDLHHLDGTLVGGYTAQQVDTQAAAQHDRKVIVPVVLAIIVVILVALLRSLLTPLLLVATVALNYLATLGVSALVFRHVFGFTGTDASVPLYGFVFLVALGVDYNIFLMTRVREESLRHGPRAGVLRGLTTTGGVITSAGVVLAATFAALVVIPLAFLVQIAFIVAFGVLLDTLVVRSLLVPALVRDVGPRVWWPGALSRRAATTTPPDVRASGRPGGRRGTCGREVTIILRKIGIARGGRGKSPGGRRTIGVGSARRARRISRMQGSSSVPPYREGPLSEIPSAGLRKIWTWGILIAFGGFLFGFDTGVISGALLFIRSDFDLNSFQQGSVVSVLVLGAMAGALAAARIADRFGRRRALEAEGLTFLLGTVVAVFAPGYWTLMAGRLILGLAVGAASATVPIYLSEIAPKGIRGRLLTLNQLMITTGILVAYLVNLAFSGGGDWRAMIAVGAVPGLVIVVAAVLILPESGVWLLEHGSARSAASWSRRSPTPRPPTGCSNGTSGAGARTRAGSSRIRRVRGRCWNGTSGRRWWSGSGSPPCSSSPGSTRSSTTRRRSSSRPA
ncbi:MFS transporter [Actinomadura sp. CNU-125]|uniref:MFS transporter n=1 Tax=Actinomadura sp. CNU-125 TaxID=1904961 RepID=UPI0029170984|nr:MFS transporter [Actinomadura sp. CNU-125]